MSLWKDDFVRACLTDLGATITGAEFTDGATFRNPNPDLRDYTRWPDTERLPNDKVKAPRSVRK